MYKTSLKIVTFTSVLLLSTAFFVCLSAFSVSASTLTTITVKEMDGVSTSNYPLTFGHVFKKGDVTGNVYLNNYPTQTDVKTTYDDGSIRFAVISALVPMTANSDTVLNVNTTGTAAKTTPMSKVEILATDIGATIDLTGLSGSGYSGNLQADLRAAINAESSLNYWLEGGVCSEILIDQRLNNSLNAAWEVRFYPGSPYIRISHAMENVEANYRGNVNYSVDISQGNTAPSSVYTKSNFQHNASSRWRKVFWLGHEPPEVEIHYDLEYLISTGMIPNYDTSLTVPEDTLASAYSIWQASNNDIMENGTIKYYFPTTGGREEIGLFPTWTARYLLSMDNRMRDIVLGNASLSAGCPIHYRESDNTKSFYGKVLSVVDRPTVRTIPSSADNYGNTGDNLPTAIGAETTPWTIDKSHQASFNYIPYLITGDKFYLDELYYWAAWNASSESYNPDWGRDYAKGIIRDQVRGEAWGIRNIAHAAVMATDLSPESTYFNTIISNNIAEWSNSRAVSPLKYWHYDSGSEGRTSGTVSDPADPTTVKYIVAPWMDDFVAIVLRHMKDIGFSTQVALSNLGQFTIGRSTHPDWNHYNAAPYHFPGLLYSGDEVSTWEQANSLMVSQPTSFPVDDYPNSYNFVALAALSGLVDQTNGQVAYNWLKANVNDQSELNDDPTWALVPRGPKPAVNLRLE